MNFNENFEYYLIKKFEELCIDYPYTIEEIVRHVDVNYITPLQSECYKLHNNKINIIEALLKEFDNPDNNAHQRAAIKNAKTYLNKPPIRHCDHCGTDWSGKEKCPECFQA